MRTITALLVLAASLAGCTDGGGDYSLSGTFTEDATQQQMQELVQYAQDRGGDMVLMESFPVQFRATGLSNAGCDAVRDYALERDYVAAVGSCTDGGS